MGFGEVLRISLGIALHDGLICLFDSFQTNIQDLHH